MNMDAVIMLGVGAVMVAVALGMMFVSRNALYGVRCAWSMHSDDVWKNINVVSGYVLAMCVCAAVMNVCTGAIGNYSFTVCIIVAAVWSLGYSFAVYKAKVGAGANCGIFSIPEWKSDLCLFVVAAVAAAFTARLFSAQDGFILPFEGGKIATHFDAENRADGFMKADVFLADFRRIQGIGIAVCAAVAFVAVLFTKNVFGKKFISKISVACAAAALASLACALYYTGVIAAVAVANTGVIPAAVVPSGRAAAIDFFAPPAFGYLKGFTAVACVVLPAVLFLKAYANCRKFFANAPQKRG